MGVSPAIRNIRGFGNFRIGDHRAALSCACVGSTIGEGFNAQYAGRIDF
jgi:hypothetical protein